MTTLDELRERAKNSRLPLRSILPPDPSDVTRKIICAVAFNAALLKSTGKLGDLAVFADALQRELSIIREAL